MIQKNTSKRVAKNTNSEIYFVNSGHMTVNENKEEMIKILHLIEFL